MGVLWRSTDMEPNTSGGPAWLARAYRGFAECMLNGDPPYPCHFGVRGQLDGTHWYAAVEPEPPGPRDVAALAETLLAFQRQAWEGPQRQTLVVFVGPPDPAPQLARHTEQFWWLLGQLAALDPRPWPDDRPQNVTDAHWQWCFAGEPWFVFGASPAYRARRSRNLGPCLTVMFQVLRVFEGLDALSAAGDAAKSRVRRQLHAYDDVDPHPHLGDTLHVPTYKWRQYMLPDDQRPLAPESCPFRPPSASRATP